MNCIYYYALIRQEYLWKKKDGKVKHRPRTMTPEEVNETKIKLSKVGVELKNF